MHQEWHCFCFVPVQSEIYFPVIKSSNTAGVEIIETRNYKSANLSSRLLPAASWNWSNVGCSEVKISEQGGTHHSKSASVHGQESDIWELYWSLALTQRTFAFSFWKLLFIPMMHASPCHESRVPNIAEVTLLLSYFTCFASVVRLALVADGSEPPALLYWLL